MQIKTLLSLEAADKIVDQALQLGLIEEMHPLAVAVLDNGGHPGVVKRQAGALIMRGDIGIGKAWASNCTSLGQNGLSLKGLRMHI